MNFLEGLNEAQAQAVQAKDGPVLIVAGAGTGKTTVITRRIAWLLEEKNIPGSNILSLTFTDKAAGEMEERVSELIGSGYYDLEISTFHSFCEKIVSRFGLEIGVPTDALILDDTAQWLLLREHLDELPLLYYKPKGNQTKFLRDILSHISRAKDEAVSPEEYIEYAEKLRLQKDKAEAGDSDEYDRISEIANVYHVYQQLLLDKGALDFGDLILYALQILQTRKRVRELYQKTFDYILVDEFQDTNWAQYELVKLLAGEKKNIMVVGDDDQAIYKFRGASVSNIKDFKKDFPESTDIVITQNYRSSQNILDVSYTLIQENNPDRLEVELTNDDGSAISKKLIAHSTEPGVKEHFHGKTIHDEVNFVCETLLKRKELGVEWKDMAILVRANDSAEPFLLGLSRLNIPYQYWATKGLYKKPVVLDILAYVRLLGNYHESQGLYRLLTTPMFGLHYEDISKLQRFQKQKAKTLYEALKESQMIQYLSDEAREKIQKLMHLIEKHTSLTATKSAGEIIDAFMQDSGYMKLLSDAAQGPVSEDQQRAVDALSSVNAFYQRIETFEKAHDDRHIKHFIDEITLEQESGNSGKIESATEVEDDAVNIMTIHGSKGLEFDTVFVVSMVEQRFPTANRGERIPLPDELIHETLPTGDEHIQEERRLCYVAFTRAKKALYVTSAEDYGGVRKKKPSRFLEESTIAQPQSFESPRTAGGGAVALNKINPRIPEVNFVPSFLSHSRLQQFSTCPLQYKYKYILNVPDIEGSPHFSFGNTMHAVLQKAFGVVKDRVSQVAQTDLFGNTIEAASGPIVLTEKELLEMYKNAWQDDWYDSKSQKDEYYKKGREIIKNIADKYKDGWPVPYSLEQSFKLPFQAGSRKVYTLCGRIDRIDPITIEGEEGVEVIDYKTGTPKDDKITKENKQQLLLYQMAVQDVLGLKPLKLTYYYLENDSTVEFLGNNEEIEELKAEIFKQIEEMEKSNFLPTPGFQCRWCPFKDICDFSQA
ncbi:MAG: UvrD-helicase domain-containing protein [Candidatus Jacksonbacteria bacterium]|nr:UvrD-helicase domain-containing protein [Candidatus Jacksonbacteria bacterium]MBT6757835.1 UvrD-helicase domain-containing protein [Candidatus Jacksonbacteria bacterium]MBT6955373.1 UvrD-helicase domain-containing protein [Candidatus Jacksonbacteria bacterium]